MRTEGVRRRVRDSHRLQTAMQPGFGAQLHAPALQETSRFHRHRRFGPRLDRRGFRRRVAAIPQVRGKGGRREGCPGSLRSRGSRGSRERSGRSDDSRDGGGEVEDPRRRHGTRAQDGHRADSAAHQCRRAHGLVRVRHAPHRHASKVSRAERRRQESRDVRQRRAGSGRDHDEKRRRGV